MDDVNFVIIYVWEAHPTQEGSLSQPETYRERVEMARRTIAAEEITVTLLVDEMDNPLMCTYGPAPNNAYLIGTDGKIVYKQGWYNPSEMERAIQDYLGN
jgi:hypothetical protein